MLENDNAKANSKEIKYKAEARELLKEGVDALANAVKGNARSQGS